MPGLAAIPQKFQGSLPIEVFVTASNETPRLAEVGPEAVAPSPSFVVKKHSFHPVVVRAADAL
jgi:hypothetical protein